MSDLNTRAGTIEDWIKQSTASDVLKSFVLALASMAVQTSGAESERYYKLIRLVVGALD